MYSKTDKRQVVEAGLTVGRTIRWHEAKKPGSGEMPDSEGYNNNKTFIAKRQLANLKFSVA